VNGLSGLNEAWLCEGGGYTRRWAVAKKQLFGYWFQGLLEEKRRAMGARIGKQERRKELCLGFGRLGEFNKGCIEAARESLSIASGHCFFIYYKSRRV
jgi:hypothetical protein